MKKKIITLFIFGIAILFATISNAATDTEYTASTTMQSGVVVNWKYTLDENGKVKALVCTNKEAVSGAITIPAEIDGHQVKSLGAISYTGVFQDCLGITSVDFENGIEELGNRAFDGCSGITSVNIPDSVTKIGRYAFQDCTGLRNIDIPDSVTIIENDAFSGCSEITSVKLSKNITSISEGTFQDCASITEIIIPHKVTSIFSGTISSYGAFAGCTNLKKILIPDTVATIENRAFHGCNNLTIYGNESSKAQSYAEENDIKFDYISNWDKDDIGDDITVPTVKRIYVADKSNYYNSTTKKYEIPTGAKIKIGVQFDENIAGQTSPTLTIKIGTGNNIELKEGTISGNTIFYSYNTKSSDSGVITILELKGGNVTDVSGNAANLTVKQLEDSAVVTINGKSENTNKVKVPSDAVEYNGHYYLLIQQKMKWQEAKTYCESLGGHLLTLNTKEEDEFIFKYAKNLTTIKYWLGFYQENNSYRWVTEETVDYTNWGKGEPNNQSGAQGYAVVYMKDWGSNIKAGQWDDVGLNDTFYFVCEWDDGEKVKEGNLETNKLDSSTADKTLPKAGIDKIIIISILVISLTGVFSLVGYKNIKLK